MSASISLVVAMAENRVIGMDGGMPWSLSSDLQRFKKMTLGKPIIMGRKTFEAIGKPLPGRTSIVVTRDEKWQAPGAVPVQDVETALELGQSIATQSGVDDICVIGGGEIYRQTLAHADRLLVTLVHAEPDGDTWFPEFDKQDWIEKKQKPIPAGERDSHATTYVEYEKQGNI